MGNFFNGDESGGFSPWKWEVKRGMRLGCGSEVVGGCECSKTGNKVEELKRKKKKSERGMRMEGIEFGEAVGRGD
jgi:hypothetical protein